MMAGDIKEKWLSIRDYEQNISDARTCFSSNLL